MVGTWEQEAEETGRVRKSRAVRRDDLRKVNFEHEQIRQCFLFEVSELCNNFPIHNFLPYFGEERGYIA